MAEGSAVYHGGYAGAAGGAPLYVMGQFEREPRYPMELLQLVNGRGGSPGVGQRRPVHARRERYTKSGDATAFGYESDDSSLSSNASGSTQSTSDKGDAPARVPEVSAGQSIGAGTPIVVHSPIGQREWRHRAGTGRLMPRMSRPRIAPERYLSGTYPFQVTYTPEQLLNGSKWDTLSQEIWDRFLAAQQTEDTFRNKMNFWRFLYITIKAIFPRYGLYLVGSTMSGFGLDSSDMDLCLLVRPLDCADPRAHALMHLNFLLDYLKAFHSGVVAGLELIQAKVPILKFHDVRYGLQVDLNCNNVVGIRNTNLLYCYSQLDWRVRPLVLVAKLWAQAHNINDARQRTLSSYSLTLMVISYLQCGVSPPVLPCLCVRSASWEGAPHPRWTPPPHLSQNNQPLGELFLGLLHYYATFQYEKLAVSVRAGRCVPVQECRMARSHKNDPHQWKLLCVEEPFDLTNTARSVYDPETFEKIVTTFRDSYKSLSGSLRLVDAMEAPVAPER